MLPSLQGSICSDLDQDPWKTEMLESLEYLSSVRRCGSKQRQIVLGKAPRVCFILHLDSSPRVLAELKSTKGSNVYANISRMLLFFRGSKHLNGQFTQLQA